MRAPSRYTPFFEPRSSTTTPHGPALKATWRALIAGSSIDRSQPTCAPMVMVRPGASVTPRLGALEAPAAGLAAALIRQGPPLMGSGSRSVGTQSSDGETCV